MNPMMGHALTHPKQLSLHNLEGTSLQVDQKKPQPTLGIGNGQFW
jgi:hypothetical protein